jgi:hypothetical protein
METLCCSGACVSGTIAARLSQPLKICITPTFLKSSRRPGLRLRTLNSSFVLHHVCDKWPYTRVGRHCPLRQSPIILVPRIGRLTIEAAVSPEPRPEPFPPIGSRQAGPFCNVLIVIDPVLTLTQSLLELTCRLRAIESGGSLSPPPGETGYQTNARDCPQNSSIAAASISSGFTRL